MPEPNTVTAPRDPEPRAESTAGWVQAPSAPEPALEAPTVTRTVASTPGPGDADRQTHPEETERIREAGADGSSQLPDIPGYHIEKVVGRGGMGIVYRAIDLKLNRVVALKVMHPGGRDYQQIQGRFEREVQALALSRHPNVVQVHHAGEWRGFPYYTMDYVPGGSLGHQLGRFQSNPTACAKLVAKVARAMQALHDHNVIHRDLKPLNILLGDGDEPLVADFGLALWLEDDPESGYTATGYPVGTHQYMAPEQTEGKRSEYSAGCDVWAIGVVLYELLAGRRPFPDDGKSDVLKRIREDEPPSLPETVPADLTAIVYTCLAKLPAERYATAAALADDLEAWLRGERGSRQPARRRGWLVATGLVALVALIAIPVAVMPGGKPLPPQKVTIRALLEDHRTADVIGANGMPRFGTRLLPGCMDGVGQGPTGYATLSSPVYSAAELSGEDLPWPVKLRAEYAMPQSQENRSFAGVFIGGKVTPAAIPWQSLVHLIHEEIPIPRLFSFGPKFVIQRAYFEVAVWGERPPGERSAMPDAVVRVSPDISPTSDETPEWHAVELVIHPNGVSGTWNGMPLKPVSGPLQAGRPPKQSVQAWKQSVQYWLSSPSMHGRPTVAPPYIGPGIGVCVFNATATFRNVQLVPLQPPIP
jgi:hypothetical protein